MTPDQIAEAQRGWRRSGSRSKAAPARFATPVLPCGPRSAQTPAFPGSASVVTQRLAKKLHFLDLHQTAGVTAAVK
jgi:hypothetical protein